MNKTKNHKRRISTYQAPFNHKHFTWPEIVSREEAKKLCDFIENNFSGYEDSKYGSGNQLGEYGKQISTVKLIEYIKVKPFLSNLLDHAVNIANLDFGYIVFAPYGAQNLLYNTYQSKDKDHYGWHIDESRQPNYDIKLTLLINLSTESYKGGEFQTFEGSKEGQTSHPIYDEPGSAIMFKSYMPHRVLPVTSGTRKSLTMFIFGPKFQ